MNLNIESLEIFIKLAELGSFTEAARQLGVPKSKVSLQLKALEGQLESQLVQRSTRMVRLTPEGEEFLVRARRLVQDAEELLASSRSPQSVKGRVRVDLPVAFARDLILPRLPSLLARHPGLELVVSATDRKVDPFREGFDCVLRVGRLTEPGLVARRVGELRMANAASPEYLRKHGVPERVEQLEQHFLVHYSATLGAEAPGFEYFDGERYRDWPMRSRVTVNNADAYLAACIAGLGIIQTPRIGLTKVLAQGTCVEVLPHLTCAPMPVSLLHTHGRSVPRRVRAVLSWMTELLTGPESHLSVR